MNVEVALATVCEWAEVRDDGTIDIRGGCPEWIGAPELPWSGRIRFALVLKPELTDPGGRLNLDVLVVQGLDGMRVGRVADEMRVQRQQGQHVIGAPLLLPFALDLEVRFPSEGTYGVIVKERAGRRLATVPFYVARQG
jgi:hypothetical protein